MQFICLHIKAYQVVLSESILYCYCFPFEKANLERSLESYTSFCFMGKERGLSS